MVNVMRQDKAAWHCIVVLCTALLTSFCHQDYNWSEEKQARETFYRGKVQEEEEDSPGKKLRGLL